MQDKPMGTRGTERTEISRRESLKLGAAGLVTSLMPGAALAGSTKNSSTSQSEGPMADHTAIRPFHFEVPQADLADLRARIKATKWPRPRTGE
jgi:hypothetical protein